MVVAPILPPAPGELNLPEEVRDELRACWAAWWGPLREELRAAPPIHDAPEERVVLARFLRGLVTFTERYGSALRPLLRAGFWRVFEDLVAEEETQAPTIRRLGLKLLGHAVEVLGEFYEAAIAFAPSSLLVDSVEGILPDADDTVARSLDQPSMALLRLELSAFVAFDLASEGPIEEFAAWARVAHTAARRAAPFVAMLSAYSRVQTPIDVSADIVLPPTAFDRVVQLLENPPTPSGRLRSLLHRGTA
jgi:hypothetical protein